MKHFSFKRKPFTSVPDHRELFQTRGHQELHARLQIAIADRLASLVVGPSGAGKSTTTRVALAVLSMLRTRVIRAVRAMPKIRVAFAASANAVLGDGPRST